MLFGDIFAWYTAKRLSGFLVVSETLQEPSSLMKLLKKEKLIVFRWAAQIFAWASGLKVNALQKSRLMVPTYSSPKFVC